MKVFEHTFQCTISDGNQGAKFSHWPEMSSPAAYLWHGDRLERLKCLHAYRTPTRWLWNKITEKRDILVETKKKFEKEDRKRSKEAEVVKGDPEEEEEAGKGPWMLMLTAAPARWLKVKGTRPHVLLDGSRQTNRSVVNCNYAVLRW